MILLDANLLLYAYDSSAGQHKRARAWLAATMVGTEAVRLPWAVITAFLRIATDARILARPLPPVDARAAVREWFQFPSVTTIVPGERHWGILEQLLEAAQVRGAGVTDAHLAALAIEHGAVLYSSDRGFRRFPGLRWTDPLAGTTE